MPDKYLGEEHVPPSIGGDGRLSDWDRELMRELQEFREAVKAREAKEGPRPLNEAQKRWAKTIEEAEKARGAGAGKAAKKGAAGAGLKKGAGAGLKKAEPKPKLPKHWRNKPFI